MNTGASSRQDFVNLSLRDLATPLFRRRRVVITTFLLVFGLATAFGLLRLRRYESRMEILVNRERLDPLVTSEATDRADMTPALTDQEVNSEAELLALHEKAKAAGLITALIQDAGLTEFGGVLTYTALAVGPDRADRVDAVTGTLPLL